MCSTPGHCYDRMQCRCGAFETVRCDTNPCNNVECGENYRCELHTCGSCSFRCVRTSLMLGSVCNSGGSVRDDCPSGTLCTSARPAETMLLHGLPSTVYRCQRKLCSVD
eukprot:Sspe_Gene.5963::Locus_1992_Transcript_1_1_Confidence_1.000_Length_326::g.5963::m.5963